MVSISASEYVSNIVNTTYFLFKVLLFFVTIAICKCNSLVLLIFCYYSKGDAPELSYTLTIIFQKRSYYCFVTNYILACFTFFSETRVKYMVTYLRVRNSNLRAQCFRNCPSSDLFNSIPEPEKCPVGYTETRVNQTCAACSETLGAKFKCPCNDWMTCAQRGSGQFYGCHPSVPMMLIKVRECEQNK